MPRSLRCPTARVPAGPAVVALLLTRLAAGATALTPAGQPLPPVAGDNLLGQRQTREDLVSRAPTLLVVLTDSQGADAMQAWFDAADTRAPAHVTRKSILSLRLPFFVSEARARARAKDRVPRQYWDDTLLDTHGQMARQLGLVRSATPYVFAVGRDGRVLASVHAPVGAAGTDGLWRALTSP